MLPIRFRDSMRLILFLIPVCFLTACHCPYLKSKDGAGERPEMSLAQLVKKAGEFNNVVTIPIFETSPQAVEQSIGGAIADGDAALDVIGGVDSGAVTFENTIGALDDLAYEAGLV